MPRIHETLARLGEVARRETLIAEGLTRGELERAVARGELTRPNRGWYATRLADEDQLRAVVIGARIGCVSALRRWGVWSGEGDRLHLHVPRTSSGSLLKEAPRGARLRVPHPALELPLDRVIRPSDATRPIAHWKPQQHPSAALDWIVSPMDALAQAVRCQREEHALACIDSALHEGVVSRGEWFAINETLPARLQHFDLEKDSRADSGNESITRYRLRRAGLQSEPQVRIPGVGFIDLLVEGLVPLEVDSEAHHSSLDQRQRDRSRSLLSAALGAPTIRIGAEHLTEREWPLVMAAIHRQLADAQTLRGWLARRADSAVNRLLS